MRALRWAAGVTTIPQRRATVLPRTLASLRAAGFDQPRLFVDGARDVESWEREFGLEVTCRHPAVQVHGNWILSLYELFVRNPLADRYAMFQDDLVTALNLRAYLDRAPYPERAYLNLFTFKDNEGLVRGKPPGWYEASLLGSGATYHGQKQQCGRGAVALVFSRDAALVLLQSQHMVERPMSVRGLRLVDGGIVESMNKSGWREFCHAPSLVQHIGDVSSIQNKGGRKALTFPGESFDLLRLLA